MPQFKIPTPVIVGPSVTEDKQQQKEQSQRQGLPEQPESSLSTRDEEMLSLDNINSESLTMGADARGHNEGEIGATKGALDKGGKDKKGEIKTIEKRAFYLSGNHDGDVPVPAPGLVDFNQHLRDRPRSSSHFGLLPSLSSSRNSGSRLSINPSEDRSFSSRVSSNAKLYSPTKTKVLVGASASYSPQPVVRTAPAPAPTHTAAAAASLATVDAAAGDTMGIAVTTPTGKAASVISSQSEALRPAKANARLATTPTITATPTIIEPPPTNSIAYRSSHMELASSAQLKNPRPRSQAYTPSTATPNIAASPEIAAITLTKNSPPAASNAIADEVAVSRMLTGEETDENDKNSAIKTDGKVADRPNFEEEKQEDFPKIVDNRSFEKEEEEEEEEEKQGNRSPSLSPPWSSILPVLSPSDSGLPLHPTKVSVLPPQSSVPSTPRLRSSLSFTLQANSPLAPVHASTPQHQTQTRKTPDINVSLDPHRPSPARTLSTQPDSLSAPLIPSVDVVSSSCSPAATDLDGNQSDQRHSQIPVPSKPQNEDRSQDEAMEKATEEKNDEDEEMNELDHEHHNPSGPQSPLFSSPSTTNDILVEKREEEEEEQPEEASKPKSPKASRPGPFVMEEEEEEEPEERETLKLKSPRSSKRGPSESASTQILTQTQASSSIETLLPHGLSSISNVKEKGKAREVDKLQVSDTFLKKKYTSPGDDADIVRTNVKKTSLLNLKTGKKGESAAITRVKKRKARSDSAADGEREGKGEYDDGLDEEQPLKRARQRVSERQMKMEPVEKAKRVKRDSSGSSFGAGSSTVMKSLSSASASAKVKKGPTPSKGRLSAREPGKVEWPKVTGGDRAEDVDIYLSFFCFQLLILVFSFFFQLVECDKWVSFSDNRFFLQVPKTSLLTILFFFARCKAWYHYGCVGITAGDARLQGREEFVCPPCEVKTVMSAFSPFPSLFYRPNSVLLTWYFVLTL